MLARKFNYLHAILIISIIFSLSISLNEIISFNTEQVRLSPQIYSREDSLGMLEYVYILIIILIIGLLIIKSIKHIKQNNYIFFLLALPPLVLIFSYNFYFNNFIEKLILFIFIVSVILYPLTFNIKQLKDKSYNLLIYLTLLIEWDTVITWTHIKAFSLQEINPFINTENLGIFLLQKFLPLILFFLIYLLIKDNKRYIKSFNKTLAFACIAYGILFLWQLYVVYLFNNRTLIFLPMGFFSIFYFSYELISGKIFKIKKQ